MRSSLFPILPLKLLLSRSLLLSLSLLLPAGQAWCHPIDEVVSQALIDLTSEDAQTFAATVFLDRKHLEGYARVLEQLGLPPESNLDELTWTVSHAFSFGDCDLVQNSPGQRHVTRAGGAWTGFRFGLRCPGRQTQLTLQREQYSRDRTRSTLLWTVSVRGREPMDALVPPHLQSLTLALDGSGVVSSVRGRRIVAYKDQVAGNSPADPVSGAEMQANLSQGSSQPPPEILVAWAEEGALHLTTGVDHLLFLLTLVIGAASLRGLLAGVTGFSLGHVSSMAVSLLAGWPALPWLDVVIGLTIAVSAWQGRKPSGLTPTRLATTSLIFGMIHGLGFGAGLQHLTVGVQQLWWPLLSFGLGLDVAQTLWVGLGAVLWSQSRRSARFDLWQHWAALALGASGIGAGLIALALQIG